VGEQVGGGRWLFASTQLLGVKPMKGLLCYFSNSGNTRTACTYIQRSLPSVELELHDIRKRGTPDLSGYEFVGLATFADFGTVSELMARTIRELEPPQVSRWPIAPSMWACSSR